MGWLTSTTFIFQGLRNFTYGAYERCSKTFDNSVLKRDLRGQVCLVTGANQGLGLQISKDLAARGCTLYMACRNEEHGKAAVEQVQQATENKDVHLKLCDIASLASIGSLAHDLDSKAIRLYLLVNNAGVMINERKLSVDGFEINFATNTLGTFALTHQLLPCLRRSGPGARIVTVTSGGAYTAPLVVDDLQYEKGTLTGIAQYARDKRRQIAMMERFAEKLVDSKIGCYLMHPGWVETAGVRNAMPEFHKSFSSMFRTVEQGADTVLWLALMDADRLQSGGLYLDRNVQHKHMFMAGTEYTEADVDALWAKLLDMSSLGAREKGTGEGAVGIGRSDDHVTVNGVSGVEQSTRKSGNVNDTA